MRDRAPIRPTSSHLPRRGGTAGGTAPKCLSGKADSGPSHLSHRPFVRAGACVRVCGGAGAPPRPRVRAGACTRGTPWDRWDGGTRSSIEGGRKP